MRFFDETATRAALPFDLLIERLRDMFRTGCNVPPRHVHQVRTTMANGTILIMPAWTDRYLGIKTVNIYPRNGSKGLPGLFSVYTLFDAATGEPLAQMDGDVITSRRTAAASALAADYLSRKNAGKLLVLGAGRVASLLPLAYREVIDLQSVDVWARNADAGQALADQLVAQGIPAASTRNLSEAAAQADIVSCATLALEPVLRGVWLNSGVHIDLIGSFTPEMREADDDVFRGASLFVDTDEALQKSGDLLGPMAREVFGRESVCGDLAALCTGSVSGRRSATERTVFKSVGTALEDLAAAIAVYEAGSRGSEFGSRTPQ